MDEKKDLCKFQNRSRYRGIIFRPERIVKGAGALKSDLNITKHFENYALVTCTKLFDVQINFFIHLDNPAMFQVLNIFSS